MDEHCVRAEQPQSRGNTESKFDMRHNPVYQVDWKNEASGKRMSATKRRVRFRFGFSNRQAISEGCTGSECRGEEHEVLLVWSLTSGKRLVLADGQQVHFSFGKRTDGRFETSWTMSGGHLFKLVAHAAPPLFATPDGFRQFDFGVDGCSFFDMPKIFELGMRNSNSRALVKPSSNRSSYDNYTLPHSPSQTVTSPRSVTFNDHVQTKLIPSKEAQRHAEMDLSSAPAPASASHSTPPDLMDNTHTLNRTSPSTVVDEFAPAATHVSPAFQSRQIMDAYGTTTVGVLALANESHTHNVPSVTPHSYTPSAPNVYVPSPPATPGTYPNQNQNRHQESLPQPRQLAYHTSPIYNNAGYPQQQLTSYQPTPVIPETPQAPLQILKPTMEPLSMEEMEEREQTPQSDLERALNVLVNLDDVTQVKTTPEQRKTAEKKLHVGPAKSKPVAPAAPVWHLGLQPSLQQIQTHKVKKEPKKEIMRTHAFDPAAAHAGMMVLYGSSTPSQPPAYAHGHPYTATPHQAQFCASPQQAQGYSPQLPQQQRAYTAY
jgi:hypothetical protein